MRPRRRGRSARPRVPTETHALGAPRCTPQGSVTIEASVDDIFSYNEAEALYEHERTPTPKASATCRCPTSRAAPRTSRTRIATKRSWAGSSSSSADPDYPPEILPPHRPRRVLGPPTLQMPLVDCAAPTSFLPALPDPRVLNTDDRFLGECMGLPKTRADGSCTAPVALKPAARALLTGRDALLAFATARWSSCNPGACSRDGHRPYRETSPAAFKTCCRSSPPDDTRRLRSSAASLAGRRLRRRRRAASQTLTPSPPSPAPDAPPPPPLSQLRAMQMARDARRLAAYLRARYLDDTTTRCGRLPRRPDSRLVGRRGTASHRRLPRRRRGARAAAAAARLRRSRGSRAPPRGRAAGAMRFPTPLPHYLQPTARAGVEHYVRLLHKTDSRRDRVANLGLSRDRTSVPSRSAARVRDRRRGGSLHQRRAAVRSGRLRGAERARPFRRSPRAARAGLLPVGGALHAARERAAGALGRWAPAVQLFASRRAVACAPKTTAASPRRSWKRRFATCSFSALPQTRRIRSCSPSPACAASGSPSSATTARSGSRRRARRRARAGRRRRRRPPHLRRRRFRHHRRTGTTTTARHLCGRVADVAGSSSSSSSDRLLRRREPCGLSAAQCCARLRSDGIRRL